MTPPNNITSFRKDLFKFADAALAGDTVAFTHRGVRFRLVPERSGNVLDRITPLKVINPEYADLDTHDLRKEMQQSWERDWSEL